MYRQVHERLARLSQDNAAAARGDLANLRHGVGRFPGELPSLWGMLFAGLPEEMLGRYGEPSKEEWAIYSAMTLYALHQQGRDPRNDSVLSKGKDVSLGRAAARLAAKLGGDTASRERVGRRFYQVALAPDIAAMAYYLRGFIQILRAEGVDLDYPMLAKDLYQYQFNEGPRAVRLRWGQDFYAIEKQDEEEKGKEENDA